MPSYTDIFGGGTVQPSQVSYVKYTFDADIELVWPTSFTDSTNVTAKFIRLEPTQDNLVVTFPAANEVSVGYDFIINNVGTRDVSIHDASGNFLLNAAQGSLTYLILTANTTVAGEWGVGPFAGGAGAVTQVAALSNTAALTITGSPINASGTLTFALSLLNLWNAQGNGTLDGAKLLGGSVAGTAITDGTEPIAKMVSTGQSCFLVGNDADQSYSELQYSQDGSQLWNIPTQAVQNARPSLQTLTAIWNAQGAGTLDGTKLNNLGQIAPFAMVNTFDGTNILKGENVSSINRISTGTYRINFTTPAVDTNYIAVGCSQRKFNPGLPFLNFMNLFLQDNSGALIDGGFSVIIYSF